MQMINEGLESIRIQKKASISTYSMRTQCMSVFHFYTIIGDFWFMHIFAGCYWRILFSFISILAAHLIFHHMIFAFFFFIYHDIQLIDERLSQNPPYVTIVLEKWKNWTSSRHKRHNNICVHKSFVRYLHWQLSAREHLSGLECEELMDFVWSFHTRLSFCIEKSCV